MSFAELCLPGSELEPDLQRHCMLESWGIIWAFVRVSQNASFMHKPTHLSCPVSNAQHRLWRQLCGVQLAVEWPQLFKETMHIVAAAMCSVCCC